MSQNLRAEAQIAVIGWGSLIWCPGCLQIRGHWYSDGPELPIEFARISLDKRLTLVIHPGSEAEPTPNQRTYWALSTLSGIEEARENLRAREGTTMGNIHALTNGGGEINGPIDTVIGTWLHEHNELHAAIWTALPTNWPNKRGGQFSAEDAVTYLKELEAEGDAAKAAYERAREYFRNAPPQIQTPVRKRLQKTKGWEDAALSPTLFE